MHSKRFWKGTGIYWFQKQIWIKQEQQNRHGDPAQPKYHPAMKAAQLPTAMHKCDSLIFGTSIWYIYRTKQERKQDFMFWACLPCSVALVLEVTRPWFRKAAEIVPHVVSWAHCAKPILCTVSGMQGEALPDWTLPSQGNLQGLYLAWLCFTFASVPVDYTQISLNHSPKCSGTHG